VAAQKTSVSPVAQPSVLSCETPGEDPCAGQVLETLYREEFGRIESFLSRSVGRDAASDLAQEVFVRACASPALVTATNPAGFLQRIAMNLLIDHVRRRRARGAVCEYVHDADGRCEAEQEHALLGSDLDWVLTRALADLPWRTRHIFRLNRFEQKSYRQIREELGISLSAVDYHMMKALARLRAAIEQQC
jgi:RNA polymerase sigma factor (sigma-70 family)